MPHQYAMQYAMLGKDAGQGCDGLCSLQDEPEVWAESMTWASGRNFLTLASPSLPANRFLLPQIDLDGGRNSSDCPPSPQPCTWVPDSKMAPAERPSG